MGSLSHLVTKHMMSLEIVDFFLSFFLCLGVYVLFLLTAATLLLLYPEDPESWLIEAGVLVAGSVLVAHVLSLAVFSWLWWRSLCTGAFQSSSDRAAGEIRIFAPVFTLSPRKCPLTRLRARFLRYRVHCR